MRWAKIRIAAVVLAACAIVGTLFYLLTGGTLLQRDVRLYLFIPDATGLAPGSPVRVDGIGVGKVDAVTLTGSQDPSRVVRLALTIERDHLSEIPADSTAQISSDTLIGDKFVDIDSGTTPHAIRPGSEIVYKEQTTLLKRLDLAQFEQQLRIIDATLTDIEQGRSRVGEFVVGGQMYTDLERRLTDLQRAIRDAGDTTKAVGSALYNDTLYRKISRPLLDLDRALAGIQSGQGNAGRLLRDSAQYDQLLKSAADFRRSIANLSAADFTQSDRLYADWNRRLAAFIQSVDEMNATPLFSSSVWYDNLTGASSSARDTFREFRQNPRKYLRLKLF